MQLELAKAASSAAVAVRKTKPVSQAVRDYLQHTSPLTSAYEGLASRINKIETPVARVAANLAAMPAHLAMAANKKVSKKLGIHTYPKKTLKRRHYDLDVKTGKKTYLPEEWSSAEKLKAEKSAGVAVREVFWAAFSDEMEKLSAELTAKGRNQISGGNFALPGRRYPIHDASHARNALARVAQHGTSAEQKQVRAAVASKYPGIGKEGGMPFTKQDWSWSGGDTPGEGGKGVYLPSRKIHRLRASKKGRKMLSQAARKKSEATREGRQYSSHGLAEGTSLKEAEVEYHGKTFPGYNQPIASDRPEKKKMVLAKKGDEVRLIHFGQKGYKHNYSESAKKNYLSRSAGIRGKGGKLTKDDKFSANYWARRELWPQGEPADGTAKDKTAGMEFTKQDRPEKVKDIYRALKRDHPNMPAEMKARIAARQGKPGKQKQGPPYKGPLT